MVWCSMVTQGRLAPNATPTLIGDSLGITDVDDTDRDQLRLRTLGFSRRRQARSNKEPSKELTWVMSNSEPTRSIQSFQLMDYRCFATIVQPNHQDAPGYRSQACHARDRVAPSQCWGFRKNLYCKNLYRKNLYRPTSLTTTVHSSQIAMAFASPSASAPRSDATGSPSTEHSALDDAKSRLKFGARYESLQDIVKDVEFIRSGEVRSAWPVL